uniref:Uncharacterized protein n=2 Tax=Melanopsichium pennsylvanicum TaxID=63383 RepID=A0A077RCW5_9BASI|nr:conserved hypothetical protein [Melanopsichium pennsylvanicum 4]
MLLSDALYSRAFSTSNLSILELGAGTGLPSITAALLGDASVVVASDYDEPSLVKQLRNNVTTNLAAAVGQGSKPKCKVVGHIWGKDAEELTDALPRGVTGFDRIFLADCLWDPLSHQDLLKTIVKVLVTHEASRVNVIAGLHTGRDNVTSFIRRAYRVGLRLAHIERPDLWPTLSSEAAGQADPDAQRPGNEALEHATQRILELEVCGNTPIQVTTEPSSNGDNNQAQRGHDEPRLTGITRPFLIEGYGAAIEGDVKLRNRWLTVWSLEWANL